MPFLDILPLRAIVYQLLFLVLAIAIEAIVLQKRLGIGRKTSIQYTATVNLLSTVVGWMIFFTVEPWLPEDLRSQLISYIFFDSLANPPVLIGFAFISFIGTFLLKLEGINLLELLLGIKKDEDIEAKEAAKFQGKRGKRVNFAIVTSRPLAVLWANAFSFSAITFLIAVRIFFQAPGS
ncbi:MAG: filament integrity protein fraC [Calothrix sp. CSU_2_0]|nr:filament integrity protein fraC [Calothrix sp. CSU_2_0]